MTDRPIIFRAEMIAALLDCRKSQHRVPLKPQPDTLPNGFAGLRLPYAVGDRLWCREIWGLGVSDHGNCPRYRATMDYRCGDKIRSHHEGPFTWRSPVTMPGWASRLTLIVTDVRIQRVQDISEADAQAEGATSRPECHGFCLRNFGWSMDWSRVGTLSRWASVPPGSPRMNPLKESDISLGDPRMAFASYWNDLHGPDAWDANPWVAVLSFTVHRCNIDQMPGGNHE